MTPIKPGDLGMIVRPLPCCGAVYSLGLVFTVIDTRLRAEDRFVACQACGGLTDSHTAVLFVELPSGERGYVERSRVIRIDPPAQDVETREEMVA